MTSTALDRGAEYETACEQATQAIDGYVEAGQRYAELCGREMDLEADRPGKKLDAIRRLLATTNELTGKPHSATSADLAAATDMQYRAHLAMQSEVVVEKNNAKVTAEAERLMAELAIARVRISGGLR